MVLGAGFDLSAIFLSFIANLSLVFNCSFVFLVVLAV